MSFLQLSFVQGDVKPVVFQNVASSTGSAISSATYAITNHVSGAAVSNGTATVSGATVATPNVTWSNQGQFLVLLAVTYADGTIDHSVACYVNVGPVPV